MPTPVSTFDLSTGPATQDTRSWEYVASRRFVLTVANIHQHPVTLQLVFRCPTGTLSTGGQVGSTTVPANHRWTWKVGQSVAEDGALHPVPWARRGQVLTSPALHLGVGEAGVFELSPRTTSSTTFVTRVGSVFVERLPPTWGALTQDQPEASVLLTPETHVVYAPPQGVVDDEPFIDELDHGVVPLPTASGGARFAFEPRPPRLPAALHGELMALLGHPSPDAPLDLGRLHARVPLDDPRWSPVLGLVDGA